LYTAAVILPLLGAVIAGLFGARQFGGVLGERLSQIVTTGLLFLSAILACIILWQTVSAPHPVPQTIRIFTWIASGELHIPWALRYDTLSAVMVFVVTFCSSFIHLYSVGYMRGDPGIPRFFAYLSLFTFAMLMLVTADNFVQMFFGWEGVGLCSYFLIGYYYDRESANAAAIKAFVVNRVGDYGFALGIFAVFMLFGSLDFGTVLPAAQGLAGNPVPFAGVMVDGQFALTITCILLFIGAMGKSAQFLLHTWLPDAMEGPTPVSALIHAATMVTAGVFMVCRLSPMFEFAPDALALVTVIGAITCFFAATVGLVQNDIKRVIAYSTCSQLGYMFFAAGVSAYPAAMFHLMTHAFFKALLFLGSGAVIHGMHHEQDMRKMGGLWKKMMPVAILMWIGSLALAGLPFFAGYYSKDIILEAAFGAETSVGYFAFWMGIAAALMTAFYSWRLLFMTFHMPFRGDPHTYEHVEKTPWTMMVPLIVLAAGAVFAGFIANKVFVGEHWQSFWGQSIAIRPEHKALEHAHHSPIWVALLPVVVAGLGILLAWYAYMTTSRLPERLVAQHEPLYKFLLNKWYFDELYNAIFVRPAFWIGRQLWKKGDGKVIDGLGPDGVAATTIRAARRAAALQTGYVYHYAFAILVGVVVFVTLKLTGVLG
jgi:NADH-quinone oxidoreductase subunit L